MIHPIALPTIEVGIEIAPEWPSWWTRNARLIQSGVCSEGEPAAYALVWEWGNNRQYKKGPRTVLGTNPTGQAAWMSSQAPHGWIAVHEPEMWQIIDDRLRGFSLDGNTEGAMADELERVSLVISRDFLKLLRSTVPIDSGELESSLKVVGPGDSILDTIADSFGEMEDGTTDSGVLLIDLGYGSPLNE